MLVIGGSQGIGKAAAALFFAEGAEVALASRNAQKLRAAVEEIAGQGGPVRHHVCDLTQTGAGEHLAEAVAAQWDGIDSLIVSIGTSVRSSFEKLEDQDWLANYDINVLAVVRGVRACLPLLKAGRDPSVVILGSASALMPAAEQIVSNVHKAGLLALTKTLGLELAATGVRVNSVAPGRTLTPLWEDRASTMAKQAGCSREAVIERFSAEIPLGRFGTAREVATMVVWLACPLASYVTSQTVSVDGGLARGLI